jgi:ribosome maturation factor RimP
LARREVLATSSGTEMSSGTEKIRALAEPLAAELGLEVLEIELHGSAPRQVLRIYLDSPSQRSVTVTDCEVVSRRLGDVLDAHDALSGRYMLEVSSPGVNRPLKKPEHFRRVVGGRVRVRTREARDGMRNIVGRLVSFDGETLSIETDDTHRFDVALAEVEKANFEHEFPTVARPGRRGR